MDYLRFFINLSITLKHSDQRVIKSQTNQLYHHQVEPARAKRTNLIISNVSPSLIDFHILPNSNAIIQNDPRYALA